MLRILIADDERLVREMLKSIIHWGNTFTCCGEAADGVEAYQLALNLRPDIIITDVQMPGMDGLTMIGQLTHLLPQTVVIVISGYDEFSYVKTALDLGAIGYALKPIKEQEINATLLRGAELIHSYQMTQSAKESHPVVVEKILGDLYNEVPSDIHQLKKVLKDMNYYPGYYYGCFLLQMMLGDSEYEAVRHKLSLALIDEEQGFNSLLFGLTPYLIGVLLIGKSSLDLARIALDLMSHLKHKGGMNNTSMALGDVCDCPSKIGETLACAKRGLLFIHPYATNEIILPGQEEVAEDSFPSLLVEDLMLALYSSKPSDLEGALKDIGRFFSNTSITTAGMKRILMIIIGDVLRTAYKENLESELLNLGIELSRQVDKASTWTQISTPFSHFCKKISSRLVAPDGAIIDHILAYLQSHFNEPISLSKMAATYNMSQSNFSLTFKRHVGVTFSEYILTLRMEKAKELLTQRKHKIHKVAELVGYEDFGYFGKLFKRYTGLQPSVYQNTVCEGEKDGTTV